MSTSYRPLNERPVQDLVGLVLDATRTAFWQIMMLEDRTQVWRQIADLEQTSIDLLKEIGEEPSGIARDASPGSDIEAAIDRAFQTIRLALRAALGVADRKRKLLETYAENLCDIQHRLFLLVSWESDERETFAFN